MSQLSKLPHVTEVNRVNGPYDTIAKLWNYTKTYDFFTTVEKGTLPNFLERPNTESSSSSFPSIIKHKKYLSKQ